MQWTCAHCQEKVDVVSPLDALQRRCPVCMEWLATGAARGRRVCLPQHGDALPLATAGWGWDCVAAVVGAAMSVALLTAVVQIAGHDRPALVGDLGRGAGAALALAASWCLYFKVMGRGWDDYRLAFAFVTLTGFALGFLHRPAGPGATPFDFPLAVAFAALLGWHAAKWRRY